jgi:two-component system phosphate regulon sensor histidine kinase PhoR
VNLFSGNKFVRPYKLALLFPVERGVYGINFWLILSIVVVVLLTFSFYSFVRLYLQQTKLSEMKTDFINNLTHEFNTPMANIELAIETLEGNTNEHDPKIHTILKIIAAESARLKENIERALRVTILDEGALQLHKEPIDMVQLVNTVVSAYQLQCETAGGSILFSHAGEVIVLADETHLLNCVVNLLDNSIKYKSGPPVISISVEDKAREVVLTVADNGIGMSHETQKHIFEKFYRAHEGDTHNTKGFGLGLSYVKGIIDAHNGSIEVWSKLGSGAKFIIHLPKKEFNGSE